MVLAVERSGERVARYAHNVERMINVRPPAAALLAVLMLRGPQTAGELRTNCERLHCFADIPAVEALLNELAKRTDGALVTQLPRQPGSRENRWMHLLSGAPAVQSSSAAGSAAESPSLGISEFAAVKAKIARLEAEVDELKDLLAKVCAQLSVKQ
jgi:uncharacterized protein